ncbi:MAG TPA: hypothetical protein VNK67_13730 [Burkholderiales bacterium]|nr:hypothetical protein [Burkholderiales bacterium]
MDRFGWMEAVTVIGQLLVAGSAVYFLYVALRFRELFAASFLDAAQCFLRRVCRQGGGNEGGQGGDGA